MNKWVLYFGTPCKFLLLKLHKMYLTGHKTLGCFIGTNFVIEPQPSKYNIIMLQSAFYGELHHKIVISIKMVVKLYRQVQCYPVYGFLSYCFQKHS